MRLATRRATSRVTERYIKINCCDTAACACVGVCVAVAAAAMLQAVVQCCGTAFVLILGLATGSTAALGEAAHQGLDLSLEISSLQSLLAAIWQELASADTLAFGPARLSLLVRVSLIVCATGAALFVCLDALLELLLPASAHHHHGGGHHSQEHRHHGAAESAAEIAAVPWITCGASLVTALISRATAASNSRDAAAAAAETPTPPNRWLAWRVCVLFLGAWLGAAPLDAHSGAGEPSTHHYRYEGSSSYFRIIANPPAATPPLVRFLLALVLRRPDAFAGALLAILAVSRGCEHASAPVRLLLQAAPSRDLLPDLAERLHRARTAPGVLDIRDVELWMVDEATATGSLVAIACAGADAQAVMRHVIRTVEGGALAGLTVAVEREDDEDEGFVSIAGPNAMPLPTCTSRTRLPHGL